VIPLVRSLRRGLLRTLALSGWSSATLADAWKPWAHVIFDLALSGDRNHPENHGPCGGPCGCIRGGLLVVLIALLSRGIWGSAYGRRCHGYRVAGFLPCVLAYAFNLIYTALPLPNGRKSCQNRLSPDLTFALNRRVKDALILSITTVVLEPFDIRVVFIEKNRGKALVLVLHVLLRLERNSTLKVRLSRQRNRRYITALPAHAPHV